MDGNGDYAARRAASIQSDSIGSASGKSSLATGPSLTTVLENAVHALDRARQVASNLEGAAEKIAGSVPIRGEPISQDAAKSPPNGTVGVLVSLVEAMHATIGRLEDVALRFHQAHG